ncbi:hypothetical protein BLNAU_15641 [Blattamonas nauphoetae]|uniref:Exoribonuclease phosphorolytic domain-containing protein n=1 Tax=Blattamonas nauphoetae TaxID=2049346 RepID=A0ABQ9XDK8_9EUKA|nr:hypothetical protein BLNAU_15641 [Blattamonas nauphoetae]
MMDSVFCTNYQSASRSPGSITYAQGRTNVRAVVLQSELEVSCASGDEKPNLHVYLFEDEENEYSSHDKIHSQSYRAAEQALTTIFACHLDASAITCLDLAICIAVESDDGSLLSCCLNCATIALIDAGLTFLAIPCGCTVSVFHSRKRGRNGEPIDTICPWPTLKTELTSPVTRLVVFSVCDSKVIQMNLTLSTEHPLLDQTLTIHALSSISFGKSLHLQNCSRFVDLIIIILSQPSYIHLRVLQNIECSCLIKRIESSTFV